MKELIRISNTAIDRYFNTLQKLGYKNYESVNKLLVLLFIEELLDSQEFSFYITEEDYKVITNALACLYGTDCMIDIPSYNVFDSMIHDYKVSLTLRQSMDNEIRFSQEDKVRAEA
jgi:hypothetical protein